MAKVFAYTITRANTPERCRLLLETLTHGRENAAYKDLHWHVFVNGRGILAEGIAASCLATGVIDSYEVCEVNEGQHPPTNRAIARAIEEGYDYILRTDDDVEWITKRWLAKLVEASIALGPDMVVSPMVKGLRWQPPQSEKVDVGGIPVKFVEGPLGGICRLTPVSALKAKPYVSDVRLPMGGGDAAGIGAWATKTAPITFLVYCQHIRVRHARSTDDQETKDPAHFSDHSLYQSCPYIPIVENE